MSKAKILFVEDSTTQAKVVKGFLEKKGYEVVWVENGKSAIETAKSQIPDVILLDLMLPDLNGNEVARWLRLNENTKGIPIIMLTVKGSVADRVIGLEAGADDYLPKPFDEIELNARIYACLRTKALQDALKEKNRQLEELLGKVELLAITDPLTELFNRRRFTSVLEKEFKKTLRYKTPLSCMMIDIDHFKMINDKFGHKAGDLVLRDIAQIIKNNFREVDIPARWGGEEFAILLPQTGKEAAFQSASRIVKSISEHAFSYIDSKKITVSIGIASAPSPSVDTSDKLVDASDIAMYEAKNKGRNRIEMV
ncbi:MAG: diguanylate cyclase [Thermodesulfovibrionia bacterium]